MLEKLSQGTKKQKSQNKAERQAPKRISVSHNKSAAVDFYFVVVDSAFN